MIGIDGFLSTYLNFILLVAPTKNQEQYLQLIISTFDQLLFDDYYMQTLYKTSPSKRQKFLRMFINVVREYCTDIKVIKQIERK